MSTKNLGSVKAYIRSATAPTNTDILWRDISASPNDWKAYDTVKLKWESILGSTEIITVESATVYDPNRAIGYEAGNTFVSFVNENSANPIFQTAALYRCRLDATMGVSPESSLYNADTNPTGNWEYQGTQVAITEGSTAQTHVPSVTDLRKITGYKDLHTVVVIEESIIYQYQDSSTSGVQPNDNQTSTGRWVNIGNSGGGGTGGDNVYNPQFSFCGYDQFTLAYTRAITLTSVVKSASITDLRIGKNGVTPVTITFPYSIVASDLITFAATYDRESVAYFTLIGTKLD